MSESKKMSLLEWAQWANRQLADHQREILALKNELATLKRKLEPLYAAHLAVRILRALREEGRPRSWRWIQHMFGYDAWAGLKHLEVQGMVVVTKSGHHTMYAAKES